MKFNRCLILMVIFGITFTTGCANAVRHDGPYEGRVIDAETGNPIEGVVVLGVWYREYPTIAGATHKYHDAMETVTGKNGEFTIQGIGLLMLSNIEPPQILIFKAGYEYESGSWSSLKKYASQIKWDGDKAIIPLKKMTMEARKKEGGPPDPPTEAPLNKVILMLREIDKNDKERGLPTRGIWNRERYE